jgi:hypothetical protein
MHFQLNRYYLSLKLRSSSLPTGGKKKGCAEISSYRTTVLLVSEPRSEGGSGRGFKVYNATGTQKEINNKYEKL